MFEADVLREFYKERCIIDRCAQVSAWELLCDYRKWSRSQGRVPLHEHQFFELIWKRFKRDRTLVNGITLVSELEGWDYTPAVRAVKSWVCKICKRRWRRSKPARGTLGGEPRCYWCGRGNEVKPYEVQD